MRSLRRNCEEKSGGWCHCYYSCTPRSERWGSSISETTVALPPPTSLTNHKLNYQLSTVIAESWPSFTRLSLDNPRFQNKEIRFQAYSKKCRWAVLLTRRHCDCLSRTWRPRPDSGKRDAYHQIHHLPTGRKAKTGHVNYPVDRHRGVLVCTQLLVWFHLLAPLKHPVFMKHLLQH
jgi:hypothetical protein